MAAFLFISWNKIVKFRIQHIYILFKSQFVILFKHKEAKIKSQNITGFDMLLQVLKAQRHIRKNKHEIT